MGRQGCGMGQEREEGGATRHVRSRARAASVPLSQLLKGQEGGEGEGSNAAEDAHHRQQPGGAGVDGDDGVLPLAAAHGAVGDGAGAADDLEQLDKVAAAGGVGPCSSGSSSTAGMGGVGGVTQVTRACVEVWSHHTAARCLPRRLPPQHRHTVTPPHGTHLGTK